MNAKVTIILATYNRAHLIEETLRSIQQQSYKNFECLIIDDGGTDNTAQVIQPYLKDNRFDYYKRSDAYGKGLPGCRNFGLDRAIGEYIIFFDDDDIVHPQNLEYCVKELQNSKYSFCRYHRETFTGDFHYNFDQRENYMSIELDGRSTVKKLLTHEVPFNSCAVMWNRRCFDNFRFEENLQYAEEWELYSRILSNGFNGVTIDKTLFYGRKHPKSNTGEFWRNDSKRVNSKKAAILLVINNLVVKKILTPSLLKYLTGLAISYRDKRLLRKIMNIVNVSSSTKLYYYIKYQMYPFWKPYKTIIKKW
ncbi:MAG: glycosyl transferase family 2 [Flavobacteriaceae bacterium]|nr:glycosyl transferase family 2 [Flavobacteriaceae bacterium]